MINILFFVVVHRCCILYVVIHYFRKTLSMLILFPRIYYQNNCFQKSLNTVEFNDAFINARVHKIISNKLWFKKKPEFYCIVIQDRIFLLNGSLPGPILWRILSTFLSTLYERNNSQSIRLIQNTIRDFIESNTLNPLVEKGISKTALLSQNFESAIEILRSAQLVEI